MEVAGGIEEIVFPAVLSKVCHILGGVGLAARLNEKPTDRAENMAGTVGSRRACF